MWQALLPKWQSKIKQHLKRKPQQQYITHITTSGHNLGTIKISTATELHIFFEVISLYFKHTVVVYKFTSGQVSINTIELCPRTSTWCLSIECLPPMKWCTKHGYRHLSNQKRFVASKFIAVEESCLLANMHCSQAKMYCLPTKELPLLAIVTPLHCYSLAKYALSIMYFACIAT